jgi:hypothetical protein
MLKHIMRIIEDDFALFLGELFEEVNIVFREYPICSFVYLVEITFTVFSKF